VPIIILRLPAITLLLRAARIEGAIFRTSVLNILLHGSASHPITLPKCSPYGYE